MDFTEFINSNAIKNHLKEINYEFAPVEAAFVVWQSAFRSMEEKHSAWQYIIDNMPDGNVIEAMTEIYRKDLQEEFKENFGLHEFLRLYIEAEKRLTNLSMMNEDKTVFSFEMYYEGDCDTCVDERLFTSYEALMNAIDEELSDMSAYNLKWIFIKKSWLDTDEKYIKITLSPDKSVFAVRNDRNIRNEKEQCLEEIFDGMWFKIPTPFKKGDILVSNTENIFSCKEPFVLEKVCYWGVDDVEEVKTRHAWCSLDMFVTGYFVSDDGRVYWDHTSNYLDFDYYDEILTGRYRTLKALSNYEKGEIDISLLMEAYSIILNEERIIHQREYLGMTERGLELAGLKADSIVEKLFPDCVNRYSDGLYTIAGRPGVGVSYVVDIIADELEKLYKKKVKMVEYKNIKEELENPETDVIILDEVDYRTPGVAENLKLLSSMHRKIIIAASTISRDADAQRERFKARKNLQEFISDELWEHSDSVVFLYRDTYYDENAENKDMLFYIEKGNYQYGQYSYDYNLLKRRGKKN